MYKNYRDPFTNEVTAIIRTSDGAFIPIDSENRDYQAYLEWDNVHQGEVN